MTRVRPSLLIGNGQIKVIVLAFIIHNFLQKKFLFAICTCHNWNSSTRGIWKIVFYSACTPTRKAADLAYIAVTRNTQTHERTRRYVAVVKYHTLDGASTVTLMKLKANIYVIMLYA